MNRWQHKLSSHWNFSPRKGKYGEYFKKEAQFKTPRCHLLDVAKSLFLWVQRTEAGRITKKCWWEPCSWADEGLGARSPPCSRLGTSWEGGTSWLELLSIIRDKSSVSKRSKILECGWFFWSRVKQWHLVDSYGNCKQLSFKNLRIGSCVLQFFKVHSYILSLTVWIHSNFRFNLWCSF